MIMKRSKPLVFAVCLLISITLSACRGVTPDAPPSADSDTIPAQSQSSSSETTTQPMNWPLTIDWNSQQVLTQTLSRQPLPVLDELRVLEILQTETLADNITQVDYRARDAELPDAQNFAYINLGGVKYDLGQISYGDYTYGENALQETGYAFTRVVGVTGVELYTQLKTLGMKSSPTMFYEIADKIPYVLSGEATDDVPFPGEMMNVVKMETLNNGTIEAIATDYAAIESQNDIRIYRLDTHTLQLCTLSLKEVFQCDAAQYDSITQRYSLFSYPEGWQNLNWGETWTPVLLFECVYENGEFRAVNS